MNTNGMNDDGMTPEKFGPVWRNAYGEVWLSGVNQSAFIQLPSETVFGRHFHEVVKAKDSLHVFIGTDSGLLVRHVLNHPRADGSRYLFIEPPEVWKEVQPLIEDLKLPNWVAVRGPDDWPEQAQEMFIEQYMFVEKIKILRSMAAMDNHYPKYGELWQQVQHQYHQTIGAIGMGENTKQHFMRAGLINTSENRMSGMVLDGIYAGRTAVVLAGGPSLGETFSWVKKYRERLVVLAVSRISKRLLAEGIQPDFVISVDPFGGFFSLSREMYQFADQALFVHAFHVENQLMGQWAGQNVYIGPRFPWNSELNKATPVFPGITVAHQALGLAIFMRCNPIILGGLDHCFSREGLTHVAGSPEAKQGPFLEAPEMMVETNGGWMAETKIQFYIGIGALASLAKTAVAMDIQVVNPSLGAAKVEGVHHIPWEELTIPSSLEDGASIGAVWRAALPFEDTQTRIADGEAVLAELDRVRKELLQAKKLCTEAIDCNDKFFGRKGKVRNYKYKLRMDEIEKTLDSSFSGAAELIRGWGTMQFLRTMRPASEEEWTDSEIEEAGRKYYEIYLQMATDMIRFLDKVRKRVRSRIDEDSPNPNVRALVQQWKEDDQPGRVHIFLKRQGKTVADFPERLAGLLQERIDAFQARLSAEDTHAKIIQSRASIVHLRTKSLSLFVKKDIESLRHLRSGVFNTDHADKTVALYFLDGMISELLGQVDEAIACYDKIDHPLLSMDRHLRCVHLLLEQRQLEACLTHLEALSVRAPQHLPLQASLLRIMRRYGESADLYEKYLGMVRSDPTTTFKLADLYETMGELDKARKLFSELVEKAPRNDALRVRLEKLGGADAKKPGNVMVQFIGRIKRWLVTVHILFGPSRIKRFLQVNDKDVLGRPESIGSFARQDNALVRLGGNAPD
jgi:hypothetical protein